MSESKLLWFRSTEWQSLWLEGQAFNPDDGGYIAVPENLGAQVNSLPGFVYVGRHRPELPQSARVIASETKHRSTRSTASYSDIKAAVEKRGPTTEAELRTAVSEELPDKQVPRELLRRASADVFGKRGRGRPKSSK
jgi:hypothetical protein